MRKKEREETEDWEVKKAIPLKLVCSLNVKLFKKKLERRIKLFECLVKIIIMYRAKIYSWQKWEKLKQFGKDIITRADL